MRTQRTTATRPRRQHRPRHLAGAAGACLALALGAVWAPPAVATPPAAPPAAPGPAFTINPGLRQAWLDRWERNILAEARAR